MFTPTGFPVEGSRLSGLGQPREQEFAPLLFSLTTKDVATPRSVITPHRPETSLNTSKRSGMMISTPGSVQTEATPPPAPPPVMRLVDDVTMEEPSASARGAGPLSPYQPQGMGYAAAQPPPLPASGLAHYEAQPQAQYEDVWVTIYGFTPSDVPLILKEFAACGDILQWGTFGTPQANYIHVQYASKYGAQRALLRNGEAVTPALLVGVKPLDARHRAAIEGYDALTGLEVFRPRAAPERPYRIDQAAATAQIPQPSRGVLTKLQSYIFGM